MSRTNLSRSIVSASTLRPICRSIAVAALCVTALALPRTRAANGSVVSRPAAVSKAMAASPSAIIMPIFENNGPNALGQVTFNDLYVKLPGTYRLQVNSFGYSQAVSNPFQVLANHPVNQIWLT